MVAEAVEGVVSAAIRLPLFDFTRSGLGSTLLVSGLGFVLGVRHSTDADHIIALSTIVSKERSVKGAAFIGSMWGVGHTITVVAVGSLIILFNVRIPVRLGLGMEFGVGLMLVVLGLLNLAGLRHPFSSVVAPQRSKLVFARARLSGPGMRVLGESLHLHKGVRPLAIGLVHGLAGSAAIALLVLSTIHNPLWASIYLLIFGAGTITGMILMTTAIAIPLSFQSERFVKLSHQLSIASGLISLLFGAFIIYQLGFVDGLFSQHPHWTPQ